MDNAADTLLTQEDDGLPRVLSFGEFESQYKNQESEVYQNHKIVVDLFLDFHPQLRPVLWRILITQIYLCKGIISTTIMREAEVPENFKPLCPLNQEEINKLDWRQTRNTTTDDDALVIPFRAAEQFLKDHLYSLFIGNR